jgi:nitrate reductase gamma subunit
VEICKLLIPYVFGFLMLLALGGLLLNRYLYKTLKTNYPDIYKSLGEPSVFLNNSIRNSILVNKFIWKRKYVNLPNKDFKKFCDFLFVYGIGCWMVFAIFFIMMVFGW